MTRPQDERAPIQPQTTLDLLHEGIDAEHLLPHAEAHGKMHSDIDWMRANDPSAGSPTETLLRLLLPLSDKVYSTLREGLRKPQTQHSEVFTGSLNR